ncbi:hypothetical protein ONE63_003122 [Megalurothrips usitatus]|uniref:Kelch domain-containing protein 3 n=1 Tax=Megalurothrips usitatus TaxID=439358 RepID=A0AAV7X6D1_9NEOP|nr:hypothetical protein ONE63_003122 [Megalurothrips usitatus]
MHWIAHVEGGPRRVNHAATAVDHIIYTFGGFQTGAHYRKSTPIDIHILNTVTFRWTRLGKPIVYKYKKSTCPVPFQRYGHSAVTYYRKIFIWGGRNETVSCNKLYCFDTETLNWSKPAVSGDVPSPRDGHSACVIADRMYVFGGFTALTEKISNELYYLDLITMRWQHVVQEEFVPKFRDFHTATKIGPYMFVFGGRSDSVSALHSENDEYCPDIVYFDTDTHTWHKPVATGDIPSGRRSHSAFAINGKLYIWGGYSGVTDEYFNDLYEFNPNTNIWTKIEANGIRPMPRRRQGCVVVDNKAFIFGGTRSVIVFITTLRALLTNSVCT